MSFILDQWIATDAGIARSVNEDGYLWLGPDDTGNQSFLWLVVDGVGGPKRGDLAAALTVMAVADIWHEAIADSEDPFAALDRVIDEANRRVLAVSGTYPALRGMAASIAAVCLKDDQLYIAHAGSARVYLHRGDAIQRVTHDHVTDNPAAAKSTDDPDLAKLRRAVGHTDLRLDRGGGRPIPADGLTVLMCTDGVWGAIDDEMLGHALTRLSARDATESLIELAKRNWSDDNATACVVRFVPPEPTKITSADDFLSWAASGMTGRPDRTLLLRSIGTPGEEELPPSTNIERLPRIDADPVSTGGDAEPDVGFESTKTFSPDDVRMMIAAAEEGSGTLAFSPRQMAEVRAAAAMPEPSRREPSEEDPGANEDEDDLETAKTLVFSPGRLQRIRRQAEETGSGDGAAREDPTPPQAPDVDQPAPSAEPPAEPIRYAPDGTYLFTPQEMDQVRTCTESELDSAQDPLATTDHDQPIAQTALAEAAPRRHGSGEDIVRIPSDVQVLRRTENREEEIATVEMGQVRLPGDRQKLYALLYVVAGLLAGAAAIWFFLKGG